MAIKLLLADDSITIQKVIGIIFGGEDYSLTVVDNGKAAVEKARELNPDVLLIDALMPGMTGYEVCEAVRATPALAAKPILLLTGSFEPFDEDKAKKCGADGFMAKPFESQNIVNKVKELAELGASRAATPVAKEPVSAPQPVTSSPPRSDTVAETAPVLANQQSESSQTVAPSDIWGAFTPDTDSAIIPEIIPEALNTATPVVQDYMEPDVFAIVSEESDSQIVSGAVPESSSNHHTGTQWIPVEEHTFEFQEEVVAELPDAAFSSHSPPAIDTGFGDISFEDEPSSVRTPVSTVNIEPPPVTLTPQKPEPVSFTESVPLFETAAPLVTPPEQSVIPLDSAFGEIAFEEEVPIIKPVFTQQNIESATVLPVPQPEITTFKEPPRFTPSVTPVEVPSQSVVSTLSAPIEVTPTPPVVAVPKESSPISSGVSLTEEQIKAAVASLSKEVIERIVWEVVPDLAETMIREAIRKIREGI